MHSVRDSSLVSHKPSTQLILVQCTHNRTVLHHTCNLYSTVTIAPADNAPSVERQLFTYEEEFFLMPLSTVAEAMSRSAFSARTRCVNTPTYRWLVRTCMRTGAAGNQSHSGSSITGWYVMVIYIYVIVDIVNTIYTWLVCDLL